MAFACLAAGLVLAFSSTRVAAHATFKSGVDDDPKSCAAHSECGEMSGDCCPRDDGMMLDCCNAKCLKHDACKAEHRLKGYCCPSMEGVMLKCCDEETEAEATSDITAPTKHTTEDDPKSCAAHPECGELEGDCCPNADGAMLSCCKAECDEYEACEEAGHEGYCCPSAEGVMLDCCSEKRDFQNLVV